MAAIDMPAADCHVAPPGIPKVRKNWKPDQRRVLVYAQVGVALVSVRDELMPVRTTDGGRIWRIDGPGLFTEQAADAATVVNNLDAENASTFYAYGGVGGHENLPVGGHRNSPLLAAVWDRWPSFLPTVSVLSAL